MRTSAALPMEPWRSRPPPAASSHWSPISWPARTNFEAARRQEYAIRLIVPLSSPRKRGPIFQRRWLWGSPLSRGRQYGSGWVGSGKTARGRGSTGSVAGLIHRREFAAAEIHHARGQPTAPRDPVAHVCRVDVHQQLRRLAARHLLAIAAGMPGRMEAEPRARGDADALVRDHAEQHGARRQAGAVDDDPLAGAAQRHQIFEVRADLAPGIRFDSYPSPCSRRRPGGGGATLAQTLKIKCGLNVKSRADRTELSLNVVNRRW